MDLETSATDTAAPDVAAAAAAAALVALPQAADDAAGESTAGATHAQCFPRLFLPPSVAAVDCAHCWAGDSMAPHGAGPRVDSDGQQLCELCPVRLSRAKGTAHVYGFGHICQRCYDRQRRPARAAAIAVAVPAPTTPHKRRAASDPGEQSPRTPSPRRMRPTTFRITPPEPAPVQKKQRTTRQDDRIMRLLDETHARRMAVMQQQQQ